MAAIGQTTLNPIQVKLHIGPNVLSPSPADIGSSTNQNTNLGAYLGNVMMQGGKKYGPLHAQNNYSILVHYCQAKSGASFAESCSGN